MSAVKEECDPTGSHALIHATSVSLIASLVGKDHAAFEAALRPALARLDNESLWKAIAAAHPASYDIFDALDAWAEVDRTAPIRRLLPAVVYVDGLRPPDLSRLLAIASRCDRSLLSQWVRVMVGVLEREPTLVQEFANSLLSPTLDENLIRAAATAIANAAPQQAARMAVELELSTSAHVCLFVALLSGVPLHSREAKAVVLGHEAELIARLQLCESTAGVHAWIALTRCAEVSSQALSYLEIGLRKRLPDCVNAVSLWLMHSPSASLGADAKPVESILDELFEAGLENESVRGSVDQAASALLDNPHTRAIAKQRLLDLGHRNANVVELFPETFDALNSSPQEYGVVLTQWLIDNRTSIQSLRSLLGFCISGKTAASLDISVLAASDDSQKVLAARRLLGLTVHGPTLCSFIAVLAESPGLQPTGLRIAEQMLDIAYLEYPGATMTFLRARVSAAAKLLPHGRLYRGVLANGLRWQRVLDKLPRLRELEPTSLQWRAIREQRQRMHREVMRMARARSVFASIVTNLNVSQGHRFATHTQHGAPQVSAMREASHSIELPSTELSDPVGGFLRRATFLSSPK